MIRHPELQITYIVHSTSEDNESGIVSGLYDTPLSEKGRKQANQLSTLLSQQKRQFGAIYCSNLQRSRETAQILFPDRQITTDIRLSEIDYGLFTHCVKDTIEVNRIHYTSTSYPSGESYEGVVTRILDFCMEKKDQKAVTIVSHQAPQLALEKICNRKNWQEIFSEDWRLCGGWQPYWSYNFSTSVI